jgi:murein L,D-transpeptidase YafK
MVVAVLGLLGTAGAIATGWRAGSQGPPPVPQRGQGGVTLVVLSKAERSLRLVDARGNVVARYDVALGSDPVGHKQREGDGRTPEGRYVLDWRNPASAYHLSLHVSYPDAADREAADARGDAPGGMIMIHGIRNGLGWIGAAHRLMDWTDGCIAVTNEEIREIWGLVPNGTPIEIRP